MTTIFLKLSKGYQRKFDCVYWYKKIIHSRTIAIILQSKLIKSVIGRDCQETNQM